MTKSLPIVLGLLAVPRAVLHDLDLLSEGSAVNAFLVFGPLVIWVVTAAVVASRPFVTLLVAGAVYGVCLAVVHNVFWDDVELGGNLTGRFPTVVEQLLGRGATTVSSLATGLTVGGLCGAAAWALRRPLGSGRKRSSTGRS